MNNLWIFSLEPLETRYTKHWFTTLKEKFGEDLRDYYHVEQIDGDLKYVSNVTDGAFLNFYNTNGWKSSQLLNFISLLQSGAVKDSDVLFFTDFWNPSILQIKYMKDLMSKNWKIISLAHAGSYDSFDILGQKIIDKSWSLSAEKAMAEACDLVVFATKFHYDLFSSSIEINDNKKIIHGFPLDYTKDIFNELRKNANRNDLIVFPHRNSYEKQPELFDKLSSEFKNYTFINCMRNKLSKNGYHETLSKSKVSVSFALQETLGISMYESMECNVIPLMPNRLSYKEMYDNFFLYDTYDQCKEKLSYFIENYEEIISDRVYKETLENIRDKFFKMNINFLLTKENNNEYF